VTEISIAHSPSEELLAQMNHLISQLSSSAPEMTLDQLRDFLDSSATTLFVATHEGRTVGMLTLVIFPIPTGIRAWIEDVVVEVDVAKSRGAVTVDLTSRPAREAANALYRKVGFVQRQTNVYRFVVEG
jgi:hypothetical protein